MNEGCHDLEEIASFYLSTKGQDKYEVKVSLLLFFGGYRLFVEQQH